MKIHGATHCVTKLFKTKRDLSLSYKINRFKVKTGLLESGDELKPSQALGCWHACEPAELI